MASLRVVVPKQLANCDQHSSDDVVGTAAHWDRGHGERFWEAVGSATKITGTSGHRILHQRRLPLWPCSDSRIPL
jgi:hypothetical protein